MFDFNGGCLMGIFGTTLDNQITRIGFYYQDVSSEVAEPADPTSDEVTIDAPIWSDEMTIETMEAPESEPLADQSEEQTDSVEPSVEPDAIEQESQQVQPIVESEENLESAEPTDGAIDQPVEEEQEVCVPYYKTQ